MFSFSTDVRFSDRNIFGFPLSVSETFVYPVDRNRQKLPGRHECTVAVFGVKSVIGTLESYEGLTIIARVRL